MKELLSFLKREGAPMTVQKSKTPAEAAYLSSILMLTELVKAQEQVNNPLLLKGGAL